MTKKKPGRPLLTCCLLGVTTPFALLLCFYIFFSVHNYTYNREPFKADEWKSGTQRDRGRMVRDLIDSDTLIGLQKHEIVALLDSSDRVSPYKNSVAYWVNQSPFSQLPGTEILVISFDSTTGLAFHAFVSAP